MTVFERDEGPGGLLRFGVPDAKLEKWIIDRRVAILEQEGIEFVYDTDVGSDITAEELDERFDAVVIAVGSRVSRDLRVPGRELAAIHPAMDYLYQRNRWVAAQEGRAVACARAGHRDQRRRQEGDRHRWRRHRHGLHLQLPPRGRPQRRHARRLRPGGRARRPSGARGRCRPSARR